MHTGRDGDRFRKYLNAIVEFSDIVLEWLGGGSSCLGAEGRVDGGPDQCLVAAWGKKYAEANREKQNRLLVMILFIVNMKMRQKLILSANQHSIQYKLEILEVGMVK
jgi:hypothetical protein